MKKRSTANATTHIPSATYDLRPIEGEGADDELAKLAKSIGHPARVRIVRMLLCQQPLTCGDIVDQFKYAQSTVSQHLKILCSAGLVVGEANGPCTSYRINIAGLRRLKALTAVL